MPRGLLGPETIALIVEEVMNAYLLQVVVIVQLICNISLNRKRKRTSDSVSYSMLERIPDQIKHLNRLVGVTNVDCITNLRMDRNSFGRLVFLLRQLGGLEDGKYVTAEEQVATFLGILAHHKKNRIVGFDFRRCGETISRYLHLVIKAVLMLHGILLVKPEPVPNDCVDPRWRWFKVYIYIP